MRSTTESAFNVTTVTTEILEEDFSRFGTIFIVVVVIILCCLGVHFLRTSGTKACHCIKETCKSCFCESCIENCCCSMVDSCRSCSRNLRDCIGGIELPSCSKCNFLKSSTEHEANEEEEHSQLYDETTTPSNPLAAPPSYESAITNHEYVAPPVIPEQPPAIPRQSDQEGEEEEPAQFSIEIVPPPSYDHVITNHEYFEPLSIEDTIPRQTNQQSEQPVQRFVDLAFADETISVSQSTAEPTAPPLEPPSYEVTTNDHEYIAPPDNEDTLPPPTYQDVIDNVL